MTDQFCTFNRIDKERNVLKQEIEDNQTQIEHIQKQKVDSTCFEVFFLKLHASFGLNRLCRFCVLYLLIYFKFRWTS